MGIYSDGVFTFDGLSGVPNIDRSKMNSISEYCIVYDEIFEHEEEDFNFKYQFAVEITDLAEVTSEEKGVNITLYMTILSDSLCDDVKNSILNGDNFDINPYDEICNGAGAIYLGDDTYQDLKDWDEVEESAFAVLSFVPTINSLRGFYLDKPWNRIGTTGWDSISYAIGKSESLFNFG